MTDRIPDNAWKQAVDEILNEGFGTSIRHMIAERAKQLASEPCRVPSYTGQRISVGRAELALVLNMLRRDAEAGRPVRGEVADGLALSIDGENFVEPVPVAWAHPVHDHYVASDASVYGPNSRPLYLVPVMSSPSVPEPLTDMNHHERYHAGWQACRAEMLRRLEESSVSDPGAAHRAACTKLAQALNACDWSNVSIGNKAILQRAWELLNVTAGQGASTCEEV